ncbi:hypothetical protein BT96DRAFT_933627 [Gymnopus androsaceus JB14]|uniref:Uncharacterized protein n=1 Tax=Gymnopus androsaceus JB14 TaxID=1447944 RepID=A0A6A4I4V6_9AGAR|nr:hypothetical protein BT96DRAFT_933627 [Gymnopus androsaceus JB14]
MDYQPLDVIPSSPESYDDSVIDPLQLTQVYQASNPTVTPSSSTPQTQGQTRIALSMNPISCIQLCLTVVSPHKCDMSGWKAEMTMAGIIAEEIHAIVNKLPVDIFTTWESMDDCDTSLDSLCNEDWAHIQYHRTTELGRILENGAPTWMGLQLWEHSQQVEDKGCQLLEDVGEMDVRMEQFHKALQLLSRRCTHAAHQVGCLRDAKAQLEDLQMVAYACLD